MKRAPRILLAGGGTGGHVYPAIAIANAIRDMESEAAIAFAGTREHLEWSAVPQAGYAIHPITVSGFHRRQPMRNIGLPAKLARGLVQSLALVRDFDADAAVGTGGYVSGPVLLAAHMKKRPIVVQEQNAYAGVTNKLLSRRASQIHIAFPEARRWFPASKCRLTGNPTRAELASADRDRARAELGVPHGARVLFVFGGSLGSQALNSVMQRWVQRHGCREGLFLLWQTGRLYFDGLRRRAAHHPRLRLTKFVDRMDLAYAAADLVLCRAGAITCSELLVTGTPAVLVPSPNVASDHQTLNARSMEALGAAIHVPEDQLESAMSGLVPELLADQGRRSAMAAKARRAARPDAARRIARDVLRLAGWDESHTGVDSA